MRALFLGITLFLSLTSPAEAFPTLEEVKRAHPKTEAALLDRHGKVVHEIRVDPTRRRLDWIPLDEISPLLQNAVIFSEDRRFYTHQGVDWRALGAAALYMFRSYPRGASTLTMQLVSFLEEEYPKRENRWKKKWREIERARALEKEWSKEEIFEGYLNLVTFRGELQGIAAASGILFGKQPHGLNEIESVILAVLLRGPNAPVKTVAARACALAAAMSVSSSCPTITLKTKVVLSHHASPPQSDGHMAPHLARQLLVGRERLSVTSTLDAPIQRFALEALQNQLRMLKSQNVEDGAILVVENQTGEVRAYVGNGQGLSSARYVDGVRARRQAGSTLKPFLYGLAFEKRYLTAYSSIWDGPLEVPEARGLYRPQNYDHRFRGHVTARTALASSLNIPAVQVLTLVGQDLFLKTLKMLGFEGLYESPDFYGPSLALGTLDVTLWELVNAYRTFAQQGVRTPLRLTPSQEIQKPARVFSPETAFLVSDILSDREARSETFGWESVLATPFVSAVKTGTSQDMRDNWCIGFSSDYTVGVWVGNFSGEPMWNVSGLTGAAPIWAEIMKELHRLPAPPGKRSDRGLPNMVLRKVGENRTSRSEWFMKGTEPTPVVKRQNREDRPVQARIISPVDKTRIVLDPDIPDEQQRIVVDATPRGEHLLWLLNGNEMGVASAPLLIVPREGRHRLDLVDRARHIVDTVSFEVLPLFPS